MVSENQKKPAQCRFFDLARMQHSCELKSPIVTKMLNVMEMQC